jgi:tetratricopeptide (TPR) repeat protein
MSVAETLHAQVPQNRDVMYLLAASQRQLQRYSEALQTLERLEQSHPRFSRLHEERGFNWLGLRSPSPALAAFEKAVELNACLDESWRVLEALYRTVGRAAESEHAGARARELRQLPPDVRTACAMYLDGEVALAEELVRRHLNTHGEHVEALRLLGKMASDAGSELDAELLLERALALAPENLDARQEFALALLKRQLHERARRETVRLLARDPRNHAYRTLHAAAAAGVGDYDTALPLYRELATQTPSEPALHMAIGNALKALGRTAEAIGAYHGAAGASPGCGEAYWSLANLKTYEFTDAELAHMRTLESEAATGLADRYHFCFAIGKALEDRADYAGSFHYYERGNALKRSEVHYRPETLERTARAQAEFCTGEFFAAREGFGAESAAPIFIVGLPRSGSTLIEQILASHSKVDGTMELANIPRLAQELHLLGPSLPDRGKLEYPHLLGELTQDTCRRLGDAYLAETQAYRGTKPRFLDKMPNNFRHLDLIHLILPRAKVLDVRRERMACGFGIYKQLFAAGQRFAYSFEEIARYYRMYEELIEHWERALPGTILRVRHEDVVADLEGATRRILAFCELDFEPACLEFHRTRRSVHSASSAQVQRPLYKEGIDHWRHFSPWLSPLRQAFGISDE